MGMRDTHSHYTEACRMPNPVVSTGKPAPYDLVRLLPQVPPDSDHSHFFGMFRQQQEDCPG